ncbi:LysR family transcriptional regulator [Phytohabitans sp. LJ34]|uniref:LysR family transcriptional regulator n=1 Tax=Phytohabitans sp. LJ34 TaxID=3452217 RepID=UPI003F8B7979
MADDLEFRLLRYFVAVAEELHFGRAAQRLFVAQQAVSRDIRRLEQRLGVTLLDRGTRRVALTPAGERLLARARQLLALHDETVREVRAGTAPLYVNVVGQKLTPARLLASAREEAPDLEFAATFHARLETSVPLLLSHRLQVVFGRRAGLPAHLAARVAHRLVRWEPLALLLPEGHPLAGGGSVAFARLGGLELCLHAGNQSSPEWTDVGVQLAAASGAVLEPDHPPAYGVDELAHRVRRHGTPVLALSTQPAVPGAVLVPIVDPVPVYPWSMLWHRDVRHPGLDVLRAVARRAARAEGWLDLPGGAWRPEPEATTGVR